MGDVKSVEFFNIFVKHRNGSDGISNSISTITSVSIFVKHRNGSDGSLPFVLSCVMCVWNPFREKRCGGGRYRAGGIYKSMG